MYHAQNLVLPSDDYPTIPGFRPARWTAQIRRPYADIVRGIDEAVAAAGYTEADEARDTALIGTRRLVADAATGFARPRDVVLMRRSVGAALAENGERPKLRALYEALAFAVGPHTVSRVRI